MQPPRTAPPFPREDPSSPGFRDTFREVARSLRWVSDAPADDVLPPAAGTVLHRGGHVWLVLGPGAVEGFVPGSALPSDYTLPVGAWGVGEGPIPTAPALREATRRASAYAERCGLTPRPWVSP